MCTRTKNIWAYLYAMWGTLSLFDTRASAWGFDVKLELPPLTAKHSDVLEIAREAFHAAAGLPNEWPRGISFLAVHCEMSEMMSADDASAIRIPVLGFLQASQSKSSKWEIWLQTTTWDWHPLRGGLCGRLCDNDEYQQITCGMESKMRNQEWGRYMLVDICKTHRMGKWQSRS
jgi:hypothetical protein